MANMSYCRFHNTEMDLRDCINALNNREELSMEEERAARRMIGMMVDFLVDQRIIGVEGCGGYDTDVQIIDEFLEELFRRGDSDQYGF